jgi:flagellin
MSMSVNTNTSAMVALQNLSMTSRSMTETQGRISTGLKVASVKDDSSSWTIAQNLRGDLAGLNAVDKSLTRAKSTLDLAISAGESISDLLNRGRELTVQVSDLGIDTNTRDALANDYKNLMKQVDSQIQSSEFNGSNMLKAAPDGIAAILSVNADSSADRFSVQGSDLRTSSANATTQYNATAVNGIAQAGLAANGQLNSASADSLGLLISKRSLTGTAPVGSTGGGIQIAASLGTQYTPGFLAVGGSVGFDATTGNISIRLQDGMAATSGVGNTNSTAAVPNYISAQGVVRFQVGTQTFQATVEKNQADNSVVTLKPDQFTAVKTGAAATTADNAGAVTGLVPLTLALGTAPTANGLDLTSFKDRMGATAILDNYQIKLKNQLSSWGSASRQLDMQLNYASKLKDAWTTGVGNQVDADLAHESAMLQSLQVKQQLGTQALSLANQAPQALLSLFR